jgi:hypothetical protein
MGRACNMHGERRYAYRVLAAKPESRRPLGRHRNRWENNIEMYLREVGRGHGLDRSGSGQRQMASCCECGNEPSVSIKYGEYFEFLRTC